MTDPLPPTGQPLAHSLDQQDRFFALSLDLLCVAGFDGYFKRVNPAWARTLGWGQEELLSKPYLDLVHPEDRAATAAEASKLTGGTVTVSFENRYRCKDGSYKWLDWTASPEPQEGLIYAVARARTEHRKAEEEARRVQLLLDSVVENIPNMIFLKDAQELRFVRFNRAGEELLGYPRDALIGKNDYDFFPQEQADHFTAKDREVLAGKVLIDIPEEPLETRAKGVRYLHTKKLPLLDENGEPQYLLGISEDITERRQVDAAKSDFIALASHQLRTPLTAIRWTLELLQEEAVSLTPSQRKLVGDGHDAAVRLAETVQTMLRVSRIDSRRLRLDCSTVRLGQLLGQVLADYTPVCAARGQTFSVCCSDGLSVRTDVQLLSEILGNLVTNAIQYTPSGGTIRVQAEAGSEGAVRVTVADTGIGIPPSEQAHVFTKLFRASNALALEPAGTGLGLYAASSLARLLGGNLSFASQERLGTTFTLTLPPSPPSHE